MQLAPQLSIVVPIRDSESTLDRTLSAICDSSLPRACYEIIAVDDLSSDESVAIAARYADVVVRLSGQRSGPAYARNRGAEVARAEIIAFVDSDILVEPETLPKMLAILAERKEIDAVCATRAEQSGASNFVSQYWSMLLRFGEHRHAERSVHFSSGCGMVRRSAVRSAGMYDEWRFTTACLESLEFGQRLREAGHTVLLNTQLQVTNLRRWTLRSVCKEVWQRGTLLSRSLGYERMSAAVPSDVVFTLSRMLSPMLAIVVTLILAAAFVPEPHTLAKAAIVLLALLVTDIQLHRFFSDRRGIAFAIAAAPIHVCVQFIAAGALCNGWFLRDLFGDVIPDATTQAYSEVGLETWPPVRRRP